MESSGIQVGGQCHRCSLAGRFKLRVRNFLLSPQGWTGTGWVSDAELIKPLRTEPQHFTILLMLLWSISVTVNR